VVHSTKRFESQVTNVVEDVEAIGLNCVRRGRGQQVYQEAYGQSTKGQVVGDVLNDVLNRQPVPCRR